MPLNIHFSPPSFFHSYRMRDWSVFHCRFSWLGNLRADARAHRGDFFQYTHGTGPGPVDAQDKRKKKKVFCIFVYKV